MEACIVGIHSEVDVSIDVPLVRDAAADVVEIQPVPESKIDSIIVVQLVDGAHSSVFEGIHLGGCVDGRSAILDYLVASNRI